MLPVLDPSERHLTLLSTGQGAGAPTTSSWITQCRVAGLLLLGSSVFYSISTLVTSCLWSNFLHAFFYANIKIIHFCLGSAKSHSLSQTLRSPADFIFWYNTEPLYDSTLFWYQGTGFGERNKLLPTHSTTVFLLTQPLETFCLNHCVVIDKDKEDRTRTTGLSCLVPPQRGSVQVCIWLQLNVVLFTKG